MGRIIFICIAFISAVSCSTSRLVNTRSDEKRDIAISTHDSVRIDVDLSSIYSDRRELQDLSVIRIRKYYPPTDSCRQGALSEEIEIRHDIRQTDTSSVITDSSLSRKEGRDSSVIDRTEIRTAEKMKEPPPWWQEALMWTGVTALIALILYVVWRIWGAKFTSLMKIFGQKLFNIF